AALAILPPARRPSAVARARLAAWAHGDSVPDGRRRRRSDGANATLCVRCSGACSWIPCRRRRVLRRARRRTKHRAHARRERFRGRWRHADGAQPQRARADSVYGHPMIPLVLDSVADELLAIRGRPIHLSLDGGPIYALLHLREDAEHSGTGVVLCPPFGVDEICAHRSLRAWAGALVHAGYPALRFDFPGTGDSGG